MKITEKDIFDFVFSPEKLDLLKKDEIKSNPAYSKRVKFYQNLKSSLNKGKLNGSTKKKLSDKIALYRPKLIFTLEKVDYLNNEGGISNKEIRFMDKESMFLGVVVYSEDGFYLHIISLLADYEGKIIVKIMPSTEIFEFELEDPPLFIDNVEVVEKIIIELEN